MNPTDLTPDEAQLLDRLAAQYPNALGYKPDRDASIAELASRMIDAGWVERIEVSEPLQPVCIAYRLTDVCVEELHLQVNRREAATWN